MIGIAIGLGIGPFGAGGGGARSLIRREDDGTVTVVRLAPTWHPTLTREPDGSVTVSG